MHNIFYTPQAQKDLADISDFITKDDPQIAIKVIETIFFYINNLSLFPHIGKQSNSQL
jgi:plasmid stabilization system protein ParE